MKITCIQMDMVFGKPDENFEKVKGLIEESAKSRPDVLVLPETWNTGFFPRENLSSLSAGSCRRVREELGPLAAKYGVSIIAGSVSDLRDREIHNTALVFDRTGACIADYDKIHLFSPMEEDRYFCPGDHLCRFQLDGRPCGLIICYDLRFPELARSLALQGMDLLFVVSQWPRARISQLHTLLKARAIENQVFLACCNSCGQAGSTVFGGSSAVIDPLGNVLAMGGEEESPVSASCDFSVLDEIRRSIPVFHDRRKELYQL